MSRLQVYPKLNKEYILERIPQEDIMYYYLKIPVNESTCIGNGFCNPFRKDDNPTCNYYYDANNKLRIRDFGGDLLNRLYNMDVFDVVGHLYNINANDKVGFKLIQNIIAKDFKLHKYKDSKEEVEKLDAFLLIQKDKKRRIKVIKVVPRAWNKNDEYYWYKRYGISYHTLKKERVYPVDELYVENDKGIINKIYNYNYRNPAYAYYGGKEQEIHIWKIYFPLNTNPKYNKMLTNKQFTQGLNTFLPTRIGVITKSLKDVMVLKEFGIQAVGLGAETVILSADEIFMLKWQCDILVSLLDYDKAGIIMANKLKRQYGIQPLMLTRGRFNQPDYGVKDISDFREMYGKEVTLKLINQSIDYLSDRIEAVNKYRQEVSWIF